MIWKDSEFLVLLAFILKVFIPHCGSSGVCSTFDVEYRSDDYTMCYWFLCKKYTASQSESKCSNKGGSLAIIPNQNAMDAVASYFIVNRLSNRFYFIGYSEENKVLKEKKTGTVQQWSVWDNEEPNNNVGNEACVAIENESKKWHDVPCSWRLIGICSLKVFNNDDTTTVVDTTYMTTTELKTTELKTTEAIPIETTELTTEQTTSVPRTYTTQTISEKKCVWSCHTKYGEDRLKKILGNIRSRLLLDKKLLSSSKRKRTSVGDTRTSAEYLGYLGVTVIVLSVLVIILADISSFLFNV